MIVADTNDVSVCKTENVSVVSKGILKLWLSKYSDGIATSPSLPVQVTPFQGWLSTLLELIMDNAMQNTWKMCESKDECITLSLLSYVYSWWYYI